MPSKSFCHRMSSSWRYFYCLATSRQPTTVWESYSCEGVSSNFMFTSVYYIKMRIFFKWLQENLTWMDNWTINPPGPVQIGCDLWGDLWVLTRIHMLTISIVVTPKVFHRSILVNAKELPKKVDDNITTSISFSKKAYRLSTLKVEVCCRTEAIWKRNFRSCFKSESGVLSNDISTSSHATPLSRCYHTGWRFLYATETYVIIDTFFKKI